MTLTQGVFHPSDPRSLEPLTSTGHLSGTHPSSSSLMDSTRSSSLSTVIFIENLEHTHVMASQLGEGVVEQPQPGSTRWGAQVVLWMTIQKRHVNYWIETLEGGKSIPQVGTSAVLVIKQGPESLTMSAQAVVLNQQEVTIAVQRSLEASVHHGMRADENQLQEVLPQQSPLPTLSPQVKFKPSLDFRYTLLRCTLWQAEWRWFEPQRFCLFLPLCIG